MLDPRFQQVFDDGALSINEYNMMNESYVVDKMLDLPSFNRLLDLEEERSGLNLNVWVRPTIEWKLECED